MATIHLLMGLPGAGKSTLARTIAELTDATVLSSDSIRLELFATPTFSQAEHDTLYKTIDQRLVALVNDGKDVVYDANLNRSHHRVEKYNLAKILGCSVRLWWVKVPDSLAKNRRLSEQDYRLIPAGESPDRMFERISKVIEIPEAHEHATVVDGTQITKNYIAELLKS